jgi:hypothetical protein
MTSLSSIKKSKRSRSRLNSQRKTKINHMKGGGEFTKDWERTSPSVTERLARIKKDFSNPTSGKTFTLNKRQGLGQFGRYFNNNTNNQMKKKRNERNEELFKRELGRPRTGNLVLLKEVERGMKKPVPGNENYDAYIGYNNPDETWKDQFIELADTYLNTKKHNGRTKYKQSRYKSLMNARRMINNNLSTTRSTIEKTYRDKYNSGWNTKHRNNTFDPLYNLSKEQMKYIREHSAEWIKYVQDVIQPATFRDGQRKRLVKAFFDRDNLNTDFKQQAPEYPE